MSDNWSNPSAHLPRIPASINQVSRRQAEQEMVIRRRSETLAWQHHLRVGFQDWPILSTGAMTSLNTWICVCEQVCLVSALTGVAKLHRMTIFVTSWKSPKGQIVINQSTVKSSVLEKSHVQTETL